MQSFPFTEIDDVRVNKQLEIELEKVRDEVLRKIGRNMLLLQEVEHHLKFLVVEGRFSGPASRIKANQERRAAQIQTQTMGQVVGQFLEKIHGVEASDLDQTKEIEEPHVSFSFTSEIDAESYNARRETFAAIVAERNKLIHHLLPHIKPTCHDSWSSVGRLLDQQRDKIIPELNALRTMVESLQDAKKKIAEFLGSDEGAKQFELAWLQQSPIVRLLIDIAAKKSNGWVSVSAVGQQIRRTMLDEMVSLKSRYGHRTLIALMRATEIFEIANEQTPKGGVRVLYRLIEGVEVSI